MVLDEDFIDAIFSPNNGFATNDVKRGLQEGKRRDCGVYHAFVRHCLRVRRTVEYQSEKLSLAA